MKIFVKDFDANGSCPTAMADKESFYLKIESGYALTKELEEEVAYGFNKQSLIECSAILTKKLQSKK